MTPRSTLRVLLIASGIVMCIIGLMQLVMLGATYLMFRDSFEQILPLADQGLLLALLSPALYVFVGFTLALFAHVPARLFCAEDYGNP